VSTCRTVVAVSAEFVGRGGLAISLDVLHAGTADVGMEQTVALRRSKV
jgi:hypothetical protein